MKLPPVTVSNFHNYNFKSNVTNPIKIKNLNNQGSVIGNAIGKAAEKAEELKTPEDAFTKNHTDVHAAFWGEFAKGVGKAASAVAGAVKDGINKTIDKAAEKAEKIEKPEDVYTKNHTDVNAEIAKGLFNTVVEAVKAPFKKENNGEDNSVKEK
ncbi:hypothetical protein IJ843_06705 [bacterium]|nr:hypothetical protein [bacterium]